jgi:hypothetical protein
MQYRNTPLADLRLSPAQIVFNRQLCDFMPVLPYKYRPSQEWTMLQEDRERALASRRAADGSQLARNTKQQPMLPVGTAVAVQNQTGRQPTKWDKTGVILENKPHSQVLIRMDGSRKATLRNRKFIRKIIPAAMMTTPPVPEKPAGLSPPVPLQARHSPSIPEEKPRYVDSNSNLKGVYKKKLTNYSDNFHTKNVSKMASKLFLVGKNPF